MAGPRAYTKQTLKILFAKSGNVCAFPGCTKKLTTEDNALTSNICHISAAKNGGERFDDHMTDLARASYENLILLCPSHHEATNDEEKYTKEVLKEMKRKHEKEIEELISPALVARPSLVADVVRLIATIDFDKPAGEPKLPIFSS